MADSEKVIKAIECRKNAHKRCGNPCEMTGLCAYASQVRSPDGEPYYPFYCDTERLCVDVLALLREQKPVIVRCKDCKYWKNKYMEYDVHPWLPCMEINTRGDWFCADAERR